MISGIFCTEHEFQIWDRIVLQGLQGVIKIPGQIFRGTFYNFTYVHHVLLYSVHYWT